MPFMFEKIADYTELLIPDDLLSDNSILAYTREALLPINCSPKHTDESVEVIGWLYQFYISEKKDDVFAALKKGKKITPENIPAATQLFTPHWIVRYLVENSLGRLWMLNHPDSRLVEQMDYYIRPEEPETDFLRISSPEEIKICDPACGSGHMLTYAFDLLYAIYEEQGYQATDIPRLILTHNLYGIEIDQRAGALAAFALTMKAREKYRRFLTQRQSRAAEHLRAGEHSHRPRRPVGLHGQGRSRPVQRRLAGSRESVGGSGQLWFADPSTGDGRERSAGVTSRASDGRRPVPCGRSPESAQGAAAGRLSESQVSRRRRKPALYG